MVAIGGLVLGGLSGLLRLPSLGLIGLGILGLGVICWGLSGVLEARMSFFNPGVRHRESYYGLAARAQGLLLCLAGAAITGMSFLLLLKPEASFAEMANSPLVISLGMLLGGLAGALYAITLMLGRADNDGSWMRKALSLPGRLLGTVLLFISVGLMVTGAMRMVTPHIYEEAMKSIRGSLPGAPQADGR